MSPHWSNEEIEAIVADHLQMLTLELAGQRYSKTEHRRRLQAKLNNRSDGSIEFKHCNISAVLIDLGIPYIRGYQPRSNYQTMLADVVTDQLKQRSMLDQAALAAVQQPAVTPLGGDFAHTLTPAPARQLRVAEAQPGWQTEWSTWRNPKAMGWDSTFCLLSRMDVSVSSKSKQRPSAKTRPFSCRRTN